MIEKTGDLFTSTAPVLAHGVNTRGVMGAGIAVAFKSKWPEMYEQYVALCSASFLRPGALYTYREDVSRESRYIFNMATQELPGPFADLDLVASSASLAISNARIRGLDRIAVPRIGCGIGGLDWDDVREILLDAEKNTDVEWEVWTL